MSIIETYNSQRRKIFSSINTENNLINRQTPIVNINDRSDVLTMFTPTKNSFGTYSLVDQYNNYLLTYNKTHILNTYTEKRGYTSVLSTLTSVALGNTNPTTAIESVLGFGAGATGVTGVLLGVGSNILRNTGISNTVNSIFGREEGNFDSDIITQLYYNKYLLDSNPPVSPDNLAAFDVNSYDLVGDILGSTVNSLLNGGTLNLWNFNDGVSRGLNEWDKISKAERGEKYTQGLAQRYSYYSGFNKEFVDNQLLYPVYLSDLYVDGFRRQDVVAPADEGGTVSIISGVYETTIADQILSSIEARQSENQTSKFGESTNLKEDEEKLGFIYESYTSNNIAFNRYVQDAINLLDVGQDYGDQYRDFIKFKFEDISSGSAIPIIFRATIKGLKDSPSPSWDSHKYIGNAQNTYVYKGWERKIDFTFQVTVTSKSELETTWKKLNYLFGLAYPSEYDKDSVIKAPILKLTIGDLYNGLIGHFSSIDFSFSDEVVWDIDDGTQLPMSIDVSVGFTVMSEGDGMPTTKTNHFHYVSTLGVENE